MGDQDRMIAFAAAGVTIRRCGLLPNYFGGLFYFQHVARPSQPAVDVHSVALAGFGAKRGHLKKLTVFLQGATVDM